MRDKVFCITGGRDYTNRDYMFLKLDDIYSYYKLMGIPIAIMSGCARGADTLALEWAYDRNVATREYPADWKKHGKRAGPLRNLEMLKAGFDVLLAFPGGTGTAHMVNISKAANKHVIEFKQ